jgi:hypothetical protein
MFNLFWLSNSGDFLATRGLAASTFTNLLGHGDTIREMGNNFEYDAAEFEYDDGREFLAERVRKSVFANCLGN